MCQLHFSLFQYILKKCTLYLFHHKETEILYQYVSIFNERLGFLSKQYWTDYHNE